MDLLCRQYQETWGDPSVPDEIVRHGAACPACREFRERQEAMRGVLSRWPTPEFSADFTLRVMSGIAEESGKRPSALALLADLFRTRLSIPLPVGAMAALLLIVSVFFNWWFWHEERTQGLNIPIIVQQPAANGSPLAPTYRNIAIPREWLGSGIFLVVPPVVERESLGLSEVKPQRTPSLKSI